MFKLRRFFTRKKLTCFFLDIQGRFLVPFLELLGDCQQHLGTLQYLNLSGNRIEESASPTVVVGSEGFKRFLNAMAGKQQHFASLKTLLGTIFFWPQDLPCFSCRHWP
jgi:hypothetical protein